MAMHLYCPENLDIDVIIEAHPLGPEMKRDYLLYILHSIIQEKAHNDPDRWVKHGKRSGFVPLNAKELEKKVPRYRPHLDYLLRVGVIECDNHHIRKVVRDRKSVV